MKITLSQNKEAFIDECDIDIVLQFKWHVLVYKGQSKDHCYASTYINKKQTLMHRMIMNPPEEMLIDHIDGDGLNNRRSNLRVCTHQQNMANQRLLSRNTSGYKGVYYGGKPSGNSKRPWCAKISDNNKSMHLGRYESREEAAQAYDSKALELYGEYAATNKILGLY